jgi:hypothetical protein
MAHDLIHGPWVPKICICRKDKNGRIVKTNPQCPRHRRKGR